MTLRKLAFAIAASSLLMVFSAAAAPAAVPGTAAATPASAKIGNIEIAASFARATLPGAPTGGVYLTIVNNGTTPDTLVAAHAAAAGIVSLHTMKMDGSVMQMRALPQGIDIAPGATVTMQPDGLHLMLEHLKGPLVKGTMVALTLDFAKAGSVKISVPVLGIAAQSAMQGMVM